ncbi:MAG: ACT domain-containing protein [Candidatus Micrarchaeaceae archaeon]
MSVSDTVRVYLKNKPYTLEALESGIVNFSALARLIQKELGIRNYQAIKAAIRRYSEHIKSVKGNIEANALRVLKENRIALLDGVHVIVADRELEIENDAKVKTDQYYVYLTRKYSPGEIGKKSKGSIIKVNSNCATLTIYSGENLESGPGVIAFLTSLLAEQNINVIELISCYTETIIVVNREDALRSYELLSGIIK